MSDPSAAPHLRALTVMEAALAEAGYPSTRCQIVAGRVEGAQIAPPLVRWRAVELARQAIDRSPRCFAHAFDGECSAASYLEQDCGRRT